MNIHDKAKVMLDCLETKTRENKSEFISVKDGSPEWVKTICRVCHEEFLPDDHKYRFIEEALHFIYNAESEEHLMDFNVEADVYTADLLNWVASNINRTAYADEAMKEYGEFKNFTALLSTAQYLEKREICQILIQELNRLEIENESD